MDQIYRPNVHRHYSSVIILTKFFLDSIMSSVGAVLPRRKPVSPAERDDFIEHYFGCGYQYHEIQGFLRALHETSISIRQIKRVLQRRGLRRRLPLTDARYVIFLHLQSTGLAHFSTSMVSKMWVEIHQ